METTIFSELNMVVLVALALAIFLIVWFTINRNKKEKKALKDELNAKELKAEKHDEEHI